MDRSDGSVNGLLGQGRRIKSEERAVRGPDLNSYRALDLVTVATGRGDSWSRADLYDDDAR